MNLNNKQRRTLEAIFDRPTRANIAWAEVEKLFVALGAEIEAKGGSAIRIILRGKNFYIHRPHPRKEAKRYAIDNVREFLQELGIEP